MNKSFNICWVRWRSQLLGQRIKLSALVLLVMLKTLAVAYAGEGEFDEANYPNCDDVKPGDLGAIPLLAKIKLLNWEIKDTLSPGDYSPGGGFQFSLHGVDNIEDTVIQFKKEASSSFSKYNIVNGTQRLYAGSNNSKARITFDLWISSSTSPSGREYLFADFCMDLEYGAESPEPKFTYNIVHLSHTHEKSSPEQILNTLSAHGRGGGTGN